MRKMADRTDTMCPTLATASSSRRWAGRRIPIRSLALIFLFVTTSVAFAAGPCASSPRAAIRAFEEGAVSDILLGFRVVKIRTDASLGMIWADIKRCDHPEWPGISLAAHTAAPHGNEEHGKPREALTIHPGETVRVWRNETNVRLEMAAVSDEAGAVGDRIRLRITTANGEPPRFCFGVVRGPANVEME